MNRGILALILGLVVAAGFAVFVITRSHDVTPPLIAPGAHEADPGKPARSSARTVRPVVPDEPSPSASATGSASSDYMAGDVHVRDHRSGDHPQVDVPPAIHAPQGLKIPSELTYAISQQLHPVVKQCAASISRESRGAAPRVDGEIEISIKNHQATITSGTFQVRDVVGDAADPVKACLASKAIGLATSSGDEPDVEHYAITLSLRLP
jgi:hypothetical protein